MAVYEADEADWLFLLVLSCAIVAVLILELLVRREKSCCKRNLASQMEKEIETDKKCPLPEPCQSELDLIDDIYTVTGQQPMRPPKECHFWPIMFESSSSSGSPLTRCEGQNKTWKSSVSGEPGSSVNPLGNRFFPSKKSCSVWRSGVSHKFETNSRHLNTLKNYSQNTSLARNVEQMMNKQRSVFENESGKCSDVNTSSSRCQPYVGNLSKMPIEPEDAVKYPTVKSYASIKSSTEVGSYDTIMIPIVKEREPDGNSMRDYDFVIRTSDELISEHIHPSSTIRPVSSDSSRHGYEDLQARGSEQDAYNSLDPCGEGEGVTRIYETIDKAGFKYQTVSTTNPAFAQKTNGLHELARLELLPKRNTAIQC